jgi:hypothetical protein
VLVTAVAGDMDGGHSNLARQADEAFYYGVDHEAKVFEVWVTNELDKCRGFRSSPGNQIRAGHLPEAILPMEKQGQKPEADGAKYSERGAGL